MLHEEHVLLLTNSLVFCLTHLEQFYLEQAGHAGARWQKG